MDFIIGGCHQGKLEYVKTQYHLTETDIMSAASLTTTNITTKPCLTDFHLYIRHLMQTNQNIEKTIADLLQKNDIRVIISDEIGYGIVPADAFERAYRETVGRQCCILAQHAEKVVRVICGIGIVIKQSTNNTPA